MTPKKAAVLVPIFIDETSDIDHVTFNCGMESHQIPLNSKLLFTVRTETVEHHKGQISFPGGKFEEKDSSLLETALRETEEEVGIKRDKISVIGELTEVIIPTTNFHVTPFIARIHGKPEVVLNSEESTSELFIPLSHFLLESNSTLETFDHAGLRYQLKSFHFEGHRIWGATARMIQLFLDKIEKVIPERT